MFTKGQGAFDFALRLLNEKSFGIPENDCIRRIMNMEGSWHTGVLSFGFSAFMGFAALAKHPLFTPSLLVLIQVTRR